MVEKKWFLQKKTAPPIEGGALLNKGKITRVAAKASFICTIVRFFEIYPLILHRFDFIGRQTKLFQYTLRVLSGYWWCGL